MSAHAHYASMVVSAFVSSPEIERLLDGSFVYCDVYVGKERLPAARACVQLDALTVAGLRDLYAREKETFNRARVEYEASHPKRPVGRPRKVTK